MAPDGQTTTYRRPSVSIGMGLDGADYSYLTKKTADSTGFFITFNIPFKRTAVFTELREIKAPAYIRWSTLMQEGTLFQFTPKQDDNPKVQIALKEV